MVALLMGCMATVSVFKFSLEAQQAPSCFLGVVLSQNFLVCHPCLLLISAFVTLKYRDCAANMFGTCTVGTCLSPFGITNHHFSTPVKWMFQNRALICATDVTFKN